MEARRVSGKIKTYQAQVYMTAREKGFTPVEAAGQPHEKAEVVWGKVLLSETP
jgi:hypothetical protein